MKPNTCDNSLISDYFETHFECDQPWVEWPTEFAIITAYSTTGENWTPKKNDEADRNLEGELRRQCAWVRRLTGYSPKNGHSEPGWAADLSLETACDLGQRFRQDAIYFVSGDLLQVSHCDNHRRLVKVGPFRERVHLKSFPSGAKG